MEGDICILENTSINQTFDSTSYVPFEFDTPDIDASYSFSAGSVVTLSEGRHLVIHNQSLSSASGGNRTETRASVFVDGINQDPYGMSTGYIRRSGGAHSSRQSAATIVDVGPAGADLEIRVQRTDSNSGASVQDDPTVRGSSLQLLKLSPLWRLFKVRGLVTVQHTTNNVFTPLAFQTVDVNDGGFVNGGTFVTLPEPNKTYLIMYSVQFSPSNAGGRVNGMARLSLGLTNEVAGSRSTAYCRDADGVESPVASGMTIVRTGASQQTLYLEGALDLTGGSSASIESVEQSLTILELPNYQPLAKFSMSAGQTYQGTPSLVTTDDEIIGSDKFSLPSSFNSLQSAIVSGGTMEGSDGYYSTIVATGPSSNLGSNSVLFAIDEDQLSDPERAHIPESVFIAAILSDNSAGDIRDGSGNIIGEFGLEASVTSFGNVVSFRNTYFNPIVIATPVLPNYQQGSLEDPISCTVANVSGTSMELFAVNLGDGTDTPRSSADVCYFVVEAGDYIMAGGDVLEAGRTTAPGINAAGLFNINNTDEISGLLNNTYANPTVLHQVEDDVNTSVFLSSTACGPNFSIEPTTSSIRLGVHKGGDSSVVTGLPSVNYIVLDGEGAFSIGSGHELQYRQVLDQVQSPDDGYLGALNLLLSSGPIVSSEKRGGVLMLAGFLTGRSSGATRELPTATFIKNTSPDNRGMFGNFNRGDQGNNDTFRSAQSGGYISRFNQPNDSFGIELRDEATSSPISAIIPESTALSILNLDELFRTEKITAVLIE